MAGLATVAGGAPQQALTLGLGMLGLQFAIGAANDWFDVDLDTLTKQSKPIPAGLVARQTAALIAFGCGGGGLLLAVAGGPVTGALAALMLGAGLAYDALLKRTRWGWLAYAVAFPLLPLYAWYGAATALPPRVELLVPVAALAGPTLHLANGLVDVERDARAGLTGLAGTLGRRRALAVLSLLQVFVNGLAWLTLVYVEQPDALVVATVAAAGGTTAVGVVLSASLAPARREWGWRAQAVGIVLLALGWLASAGIYPPPGG